MQASPRTAKTLKKPSSRPATERKPGKKALTEVIREKRLATIPTRVRLCFQESLQIQRRRKIRVIKDEVQRKTFEDHACRIGKGEKKSWS